MEKGPKHPGQFQQKGRGFKTQGVESWFNHPNRVPVSVDCNLLDAGMSSSVQDGFRGRAEDIAGHPALGSGGLAVGRPVHQEHVLLIGGQHLYHLTVCDADLVLLQCAVVLSHHHGGGHAITAKSIKLVCRREQAREKESRERETETVRKQRYRTEGSYKRTKRAESNSKRKREKHSRADIS